MHTHTTSIDYDRLLNGAYYIHIKVQSLQVGEKQGYTAISRKVSHLRVTTLHFFAERNALLSSNAAHGGYTSSSSFVPV